MQQKDYHESFVFDTTSSLFLNNSANGGLRNLISGTAASEVKGENCIFLRLLSGSETRGTLFSKTITGSQHKIGRNFITGVYSASFAVSEFESSKLFNQVKKALSASFTTIWFPEDESFGFHTGSLIIKRSERTSFDNNTSRILVKITNLKPVYSKDSKARFKVFAEDIDREIVFSKLPLEKKSEIFTKMYYRVRDVVSNEVIIPFEKESDSTLCSTDSSGMYFDLYMDSLSPGRVYTIDFEITEGEVTQIFEGDSAKFRVE